jgi:hypothetical protein
METLLLSGLAYLGMNYNKENNNDNDNFNNDNVYDTNIENKMNAIEKTQAKNLNQSPEFFKQFDNLSFNNTGGPNGLNNSNNLFTDFLENKNMDYGIVSKENFTFEGNQPFTSRRDVYQTSEFDKNSRKFENLSGNNQYYQHKKETTPFFEPMTNMSNPNGSPVIVGGISDRYIASFKNNNGNLPFQNNIKVLKGINEDVQKAPYSVYRINPRNIDDLRAENNKKITYNTKPLETIKKGDMRAVDFNLTKYKLPSYIENKELIGNSGINNSTYTKGSYNKDNNTRGNDHEQYHTGTAINSNVGNYIKGKNTESTKENFLNDFTHAINAVNNKPVFQNKSSYSCYETERATSTTEVHASGISSVNNGSYYNGKDNIAKTTMKENNIYGNTIKSVSTPYEKKTYVFSNDSVLPTTHRETTTHNIVLNAVPTLKNPYTSYTDNAKDTIKQTTIDHNVVLNPAPTGRNPYNAYTDNAKDTIKQTTIDHNIVLNPAPTNRNPYNSYTDNAKDTIKQTTIENNIILNPTPISRNPYTQLTDNAKQTIKETTLTNTPGGNIKSYVSDSYYNNEDSAKTTIKETTLTNTPAINVKSIIPDTYYNNEDSAKTTIKETTLTPSQMGRMYDPNQVSYHLSNDATARTTIKETSLLTNYIGNANSDVKMPKSEQAERNIVIDDRRQITSMLNYTANPKSDQMRGDIIKENVNFNDKRMTYSYIPTPGQSLNYSKTCFENKHTDRKTNLNNNFYKIDPIFINTLNDNPLVNDIRHQKNIDYN